MSVEEGIIILSQKENNGSLEEMSNGSKWGSHIIKTIEQSCLHHVKYVLEVYLLRGNIFVFCISMIARKKLECCLIHVFF